MEEVEILVHCATELPLIGGKPPAVFASVKSEQVKWLYASFLVSGVYRSPLNLPLA